MANPEIVNISKALIVERNTKNGPRDLNSCVCRELSHEIVLEKNGVIRYTSLKVDCHS